MKSKSGDNSLSRHAPSRRRATAAQCKPKARPRYPGKRLELQLPNCRIYFDLSSYRLKEMAVEATKVVWACHWNATAYRSAAPIKLTLHTLRRFDIYIKKNRRFRVKSLRDIKPHVIDGFGDWLGDEDLEHARVWRIINCLVQLLRNASECGIKIEPEVIDRSRFTHGSFTSAGGKPRDAYSPLVMAHIRAAAKQEAKKVVARLYLGERIVRRSRGRSGKQISAFDRFVCRVVKSGPPPITEARKIYNLGIGKGRGLAYDHVYVNGPDFIPFLILLLDATGLPSECIRELDADCLADVDPKSGTTQLRYIKRRRYNDERPQTITVSTKGRYSAGQIVKRVLRMTRVARRQLGYGQLEGPLFVGRCGPVRMRDSVRRFLARNPTLVDETGTKLSSIVLKRIRKTVKANDWITAAGDLDQMGKDHSVRTLLRFYTSVPHLKEVHERVIADAQMEIFDAAAAPRVLDDETFRLLVSQPEQVARALKITNDQAFNLANGTSDVWVASCTDFMAGNRSSDDTEGCTTPVWGCLDCRNAVFTQRKLPQLVRLLNHIVSHRQQVSIEVWRARYGVAYARILQILNCFPPDLVHDASRENGSTEGDEFTFAQLTYRI